MLFRNDDGEAIVGQFISYENASSVPMRLVARLFEFTFGLSFRRGLLPLRQDEAVGMTLLVLEPHGRSLID